MNQEDIVEEGKPVYDLEERTFQFAKRIRKWIEKLTHSVANLEDSKQLVRASGSVGANYIEANESLSKKDFIFRLRICRKEAKESAYWTRLIMESNEVITDEKEGKALYQESVELKKIFSSIISKSE
ncbi:four helix bundle protein [Tangfeifania diversioriginum]|uniref:Four helix bundle protein n=1 Tax=Tangfeifania diversioriginum TaxID=1168035 RepID=A0A1M6FWI3_9BACT|nr:four helix bundle protein [Tangfeifania diversioriginum]SHJ01959.1 four helix bundle protein [Tangfeifania diversioriginum]